MFSISFFSFLSQFYFVSWISSVFACDEQCCDFNIYTQYLLFSGKYEVGGSSQAQVVFHPNSYFPRSAKFNFTVDILGASVNLLETAARFEGFETLVEQMFGPEGYFPDDRLMQLLKIKPTEAVARGKRSAAEDEMNEIKTNLEQLQDKVRNSVCPPFTVLERLEKCSGTTCNGMRTLMHLTIFQYLYSHK